MTSSLSSGVGQSSQKDKTPAYFQPHKKREGAKGVLATGFDALTGKDQEHPQPGPPPGCLSTHRWVQAMATSTDWTCTQRGRRLVLPKTQIRTDKHRKMAFEEPGWRQQYWRSAKQEGPGRGRQQNPKSKAGPAPPASACGEEPDKNTEDMGTSCNGQDQHPGKDKSGKGWELLRHKAQG